MEQRYYNFIIARLSLEAFYWDVFGGDYALEEDSEAWLIAASARNKELSDEERKELGISNAEMYHSELVTRHGFEAFYQSLCRFECNENGYVSSVGRKPFPQKCLGLYVMVNPISIKKAFLCRMKEMQDLFELVITSKEADNESILKSMLRCIKLSNKIATKAIGKKHWLDIDIDFIASYKTEFNHYGKSWQDDVKFRLGEAMKHLNWGTSSLPCELIIVYTKGGIHILFPTKYFSKGVNQETIRSVLIEKFAEISKEIEVTNGGCPIPGTYQRGYLVQYEKLSFPFQKGELKCQEE